MIFSGKARNRIMSKNKDKLFDLESIGLEKQENAGSLISDKDLDEMQKVETHKITFRLFSDSIWIYAILSFVMIGTAELGDSVDLPLAVFGIITETLACILYIFYAAMTSSKGIMRFKFAKVVGTKRYFFCWLFIGIMYAFFMTSIDIYCKIFLGIWYLTICIVSLFAMKNNKVLEKLNKEGQDEN